MMKIFGKTIGRNVPVDLYGPPPPQNNDDFEPGDNVPEDIYGPPEMLGALWGTPDEEPEETDPDIDEDIAQRANKENEKA